jgi:DDE domain
MYLWHAVDSEGEVLDLLVQSRRDNRPAGDPHEHLVQVPNATRSPAASAQALDNMRT